MVRKIPNRRCWDVETTQATLRAWCSIRSPSLLGLTCAVCLYPSVCRLEPTSAYRRFRWDDIAYSHHFWLILLVSWKSHHLRKKKKSDAIFSTNFHLFVFQRKSCASWSCGLSNGMLASFWTSDSREILTNNHNDKINTYETEEALPSVPWEKVGWVFRARNDLQKKIVVILHVFGVYSKISRKWVKSIDSARGAKTKRRPKKSHIFPLFVFYQWQTWRSKQTWKWSQLVQVWVAINPCA